ncbi:MAG TPA: PDZ domain-containing protein [Polyangiaceae bacterium]
MRTKLAALALILTGCQAAPSPHLVTVTGISSERVAEGDLLELRGTGFPEGRPARVTLRGDLYRPGMPPERDFELVLPARSASPHTVAAEVTRDVEQAFAGPDAAHTTFRGSVEAAFFPLSPGMPPVTGGLASAVIDVVPLVGEPPPARLAEARRFAEFSGLVFADDASLVVDGVMPKSPAERAGVTRGDRLSELGGLSVLERNDFVPSPRDRQVELVVHRNGVADPVRLVLETDGFRKMVPRDLAAAGGVLAAALALFALLYSPLGRALSFLELRLIEILRQRREQRRARSLERGARRRAPGFLSAVLPSTAASYLVLAGGTGLSMFLGMGGTLVAREIDLGVIVLASIVATAVTALVFGAPGVGGVLSRLRRMLLVVVQALPVVGALACAALESGGIGVDELSRAQGTLPWRWLAFRSPVLLASTLACFVALVPEIGRGAGRTAGDASSRSLVRAVPELVGLLHLVLVCAVASFALFGGARTAALGPAPDAPLSSTLFDAGVLVTKTLLAVLFVLGARAVIGRLDVSEAKGLTLRVLVPVSAFSVGVTLFVLRADVRPVTLAIGTTLAASIFLGAVLVTAAFARRVASGALGRDAEPGVNPWI